MFGTSFGGLFGNDHSDVTLGLKDYKYDDLYLNLKIIDYFGDGSGKLGSFVSLDGLEINGYYWIKAHGLLTERERSLAFEIYQQYEEELAGILYETSKHTLSSLTETFRPREHQISALAYKIDKSVDLYKKQRHGFSWNHV